MRRGRAARQARRQRRLAGLDEMLPNLVVADRQSGGALRDELQRLEAERTILRARLGLVLPVEADVA